MSAAPDPPKPKLTFSALKLVAPFLRPYWPRVAAALAALLVSSSAVLVLGQGLRRLIDTGFATGGGARLNQAALAMLVIVACLAAATYIRFSLVSWLGERVAADLRVALYNHVLTLSAAWQERARTGDTLSRMTADVSVLQALAGSAISQWLRSLVMLVGGFALLVVTSPRLSLLVLGVVPIVLLPLTVFARRERRLSRVAQERVADLAAQAEETLSGLRTVQAYTHEPFDRVAFADGAERSVQAAVARIRSRATMIFCLILLGFGAITLSLWAGGREVIAGHLTGGTLSAFVFYAVIVASAGAQLGELWGEIQRAGGAADRVSELLDEQPSVAAPAHPLTLPSPASGRVEFDRVTFHYPSRPTEAALQDFSLAIAPGETVALVGPSGAGKSTVFQLLLRFYDPASGRVLVDGVDIRTADPAELRARIGLVAQDPAIFSADLAINIGYGRPSAPQPAIVAAASAAAVDFVDELPAGYATFLGEKGVRLSGGQRQRVAIARAVLRDAPILLLDEATSALDAQNEQAVQQALAALSRGRTTLVIAHRLATVRNADRIVVMEAGRVIATGTHEELVAQGGLYARLARLQFAEDSARAAE